MSLSASTILMTTIISSFSILGISLLIKSSKLKLTAKSMLIFLVFIIFRLLFPVELSFTKTIGSTKIMPFLHRLFSYKVKLLNIELQHILLAIWFIVAAYKILYEIIHYKQFIGVLNCIPLETKYDAIINPIKFDLCISNVQVITIPDISSPMIVGLLHPIILLPDVPLDDCEITYILRHELWHLKHKDLWLKTIFKFIKILYWWNPFIKRLYQYLTIASEINTDVAITKNLDEAGRISYLDCLLKVAKYSHSDNKFSLAFSIEDNVLLKKRVDYILNQNICKKRKKTILTLMIGFLCLLISYSVVIEPYINNHEVLENSVSITSNTSYIIKNGDLFDLYVEDAFFAQLTITLLEDFKDIPIYETEN